MTLPNKITIGRFALTLVLFGYLVATDTCSGPDWTAPAWAGAIFILAVSTDALDGYLARKMGQQSDFGRIADPVVDKIIVSGGLIFLSSTEWAQVILPVWMTVLMIAREFLVTTLRGYIETRGVAFPARWDGKAKMVLQCAAIPAVLLWRVVDLHWGQGVPWAYDGSLILAHVLVWAAFGTTLLSGMRYILAAAQVLRRGDGEGTVA